MRCGTDSTATNSMSLPPLSFIVVESFLFFFYDGLTPQCQYMVDNVTEGTMGEKTTEETVELYEMLGANSQRKSARRRRMGVKRCNLVVIWQHS